MKLIVLDRDGVLNRMVVNPDHGTIDSPLHASQVSMLPGVPEAIKRLNDAGNVVVIATNQPAWAKGKTTKENLDAVHKLVVQHCESTGGRIANSYICFHRAEDDCDCRKPKTGLLEQALRDQTEIARKDCWMVGDGVTDVQAGAAMGFRTAYLAPQKCDARKVLHDRNLTPDFWGADLVEFVSFLLDRDG